MMFAPAKNNRNSWFLCKHNTCEESEYCFFLKYNVKEGLKRYQILLKVKGHRVKFTCNELIPYSSSLFSPSDHVLSSHDSS